MKIIKCSLDNSIISHEDKLNYVDTVADNVEYYLKTDYNLTDMDFGVYVLADLSIEVDLYDSNGDDRIVFNANKYLNFSNPIQDAYKLCEIIYNKYLDISSATNTCNIEAMPIMTGGIE